MLFSTYRKYEILGACQTLIQVSGVFDDMTTNGQNLALFALEKTFVRNHS